MLAANISPLCHTWSVILPVAVAPLGHRLRILACGWFRIMRPRRHLSRDPVSDVKAAARKNLHEIGPCLLRKFQMLRALDAFNDGLRTESMRQVLSLLHI